MTVGQDSEQDGKWPYSGTAGAIQAMGGQHVNKEINVSLEQCYTYVSYCFSGSTR